MGAFSSQSVPITFGPAMRRIRERFIGVTPEDIAAAGGPAADEIVTLETNPDVPVTFDTIFKYNLAVQHSRPELGYDLILAAATANKDPNGGGDYSELRDVLSRESRAWRSTMHAILGIKIDTSKPVTASRCTLVAEAEPLAGPLARDAVDQFRTVAYYQPGTILVGKRDLDENPWFEALPADWSRAVNSAGGDAEIYFYGVPNPNGAIGQHLAIDPIHQASFGLAWQCALHMGASHEDGVLVAWAVKAAQLAASAHKEHSTISGWGVLDRGGLDAIAPILATAEHPDWDDPPAVPSPDEVLAAGREYLTPWLRAYEAARRDVTINNTIGEPSVLAVDWRLFDSALMIRRLEAHKADPGGPGPRSLIVFDDTTLSAVPIAMGLNELSLWIRPDGFEVAWPLQRRPDTVEWMPSGAYRRILVRNDDCEWSAVQVLGG